MIKRPHDLFTHPCIGCGRKIELVVVALRFTDGLKKHDEVIVKVKHFAPTMKGEFLEFWGRGVEYKRTVFLNGYITVLSDPNCGYCSADCKKLSSDLKFLEAVDFGRGIGKATQ